MNHLIKFSSQSFWSTYRFVPSSEPKQPVRLFASPLGQYGQGFGHGHPLSEADTNLRESGRLSYGSQPSEIMAVAWDIWGCEKDRRHLYDTGTWSWDFAHSLLPISPLSGLNPVHGAVEMNLQDGHLRSYFEYAPGALSIPSGASFHIQLLFQEKYDFRDECFARFFIYGKLPNAVELGAGRV